MKVIHIDETPYEERMGGVFEGAKVNVKALIDEGIGAEEIKAAIVTFSPGARTKMHIHDHEQILYIISGEGIVADEHEKQIAKPGTIFLIPAGAKHWHGATEESKFSHLYIYNLATKTTY